MTREELFTEIAMHKPPVAVWQDWQGIPLKYFGFTQQEIEQRRAELINQPDDATAPEWAEWKAQDDNGDWYWYECEPHYTGSNEYWYKHGPKECHLLASKGKIPAGHDWRKTLKRVEREDKSMEWNGEGLPPVGARVEFPSGDGEVRLGPDVDGIIIVEDNAGEYRRVSFTACKPIRTPEQRAEDEAVEEMWRVWNEGDKQGGRPMAMKALYRAGYRKH